MKYDKKYYKSLDIIRVFACIAVLLYHLNILKGGYLAVCTFFVLSGYLSCISAFRKEKFSFIEYYKKRFMHIYLPLIIVVFISISIISFIPSINWLNLKPETTSVLLGYNNYWQLSANLDYFARHVNSPFMHLWYIGILLQFDLVFPFIFYGLRKLGDKVNKSIPCIITAILAIIGSLYFFKMSLGDNIMVVYYDTLTRVFSLIFGVCLGFIHTYYKPLHLLKNKILTKIVFYLYLLILIVMSIFIDASSAYFNTSMIAVTLITCRLIDYSIVESEKELNFIDKIFKFISKISYEIYLVQYPVIFLFQDINIQNYIKVPLIIIITIIVSYILNLCISFKKEEKFKAIKRIGFVLITIISLYGVYQYIIALDHTEEMKALEEQLSQNQEMMQAKQEEYLKNLKQEQDEWESLLSDLEAGESKLQDMVLNLPVVGVGDSVMLGAVQNLYGKFSNGYFDAKVSRTAYEANDILTGLLYQNMLGDPVVFNFGANGDCPDSYKDVIMKTLGDRKLFWINVTNDKDVNFNSHIKEYASNYSNLYVIDWESISSGHPEYFFADGIHLTDEGRIAYTNAIYDAIYNVYLDEYKAKVDEALKKHEEQQKEKIEFYGNDLLLNSFGHIQENFPNAKFVTDNKFNIETIKEQINKELQDETLSHKLIFVFDSSAHLSLKDYEDIINLCSGHEIYILTLNDQILDLANENVKVISIYSKVKSYFMPDGIHLNEEGNKVLSEIISDTMKNGD